MRQREKIIWVSKVWKRLGRCRGMKRATDVDGGRKKDARKTPLERKEQLNCVWGSGELSKNLTAIHTLSDKPDSCLRTCELWSCSEMKRGGKTVCCVKASPHPQSWRTGVFLNTGAGLPPELSVGPRPSNPLFSDVSPPRLYWDKWAAGKICKHPTKVRTWHFKNFISPERWKGFFLFFKCHTDSLFVNKQVQKWYKVIYYRIECKSDMELFQKDIFEWLSIL